MDREEELGGMIEALERDLEEAREQADEWKALAERYEQERDSYQAVLSTIADEVNRVI